MEGSFSSMETAVINLCGYRQMSAIEIQLDKAYLDIGRAKLLSNLPLESRLTTTERPQSYGPSGASFVIRAPSSSALLMSNPKIYQPVIIKNVPASSAMQRKVPGCGVTIRHRGLSRAMTTFTVSFNGTSISAKPQEEAALMTTFDSTCALKHDDSTQIQGMKFPFTGASRVTTFTPVDNPPQQKPVCQYSATREPGMVKNEQIAWKGGFDPRKKYDRPNHESSWVDGQTNIDLNLQLWDHFPVTSIFDGYCPNFKEKFGVKGRVLPNCNQLMVEYNYDSRDALKFMIRQSAELELGTIFDNTQLTELGGIWWPTHGWMDTETAWGAAYKESGTIPGGISVEIGEPCIVCNWVQQPSLVQIPQQVSLGGLRVQTFTETFVCDPALLGLNKTQVVYLNDVKLESAPSLLCFYVQEDYYNDTVRSLWNYRAQTGQPGHSGSQGVDLFMPIDLDDLGVSFSTKPNVFSRVDPAEAYRLFKKYCNDSSEMTMEQWQRYHCVVCLDATAVGSQVNEYKPFTCSLRVPVKPFCYDNGGRTGAAVAVLPRKCKLHLVAYYQTAINIAPNSMSVSALRASSQQIAQALGSGVEE